MTAELVAVTGVDLVGYVEHFGRRVIQDALAEATTAYWLRRAAAYELAMPRTGDYTGLATEADLDRQRERLLAESARCRALADVAIFRGSTA